MESTLKYEKHYRIFYRLPTPDVCNMLPSVVWERLQEWAPKDLRSCLCTHRGETDFEQIIQPLWVTIFNLQNEAFVLCMMFLEKKHQLCEVAF